MEDVESQAHNKTMKLIDDYCKEKGIEFDIHESLTQEK
jgi:hypothetical protein